MLRQYGQTSPPPSCQHPTKRPPTPPNGRTAPQQRHADQPPLNNARRANSPPTRACRWQAPVDASFMDEGVFVGGSGLAAGEEEDGTGEWRGCPVAHGRETEARGEGGGADNAWGGAGKV